MTKDELKENTEFFYTLSSKDTMVTEALRSIASLTTYVEPEKINVIITPPYNSEDVQKFRSLGVNVEKKEHYVDKKFRMNEYDELRSYGDKLWITELESENAVLLDCDTLVLDDIWNVIEGDFDFKARPGSANLVDWNELFERHDEEYLDWMPNAGFLIFKNNTHKEIADDWKKYYLEIEDRSYSEEGIVHREQYALALSVSDFNLEKMDDTEHLMEWSDIMISDSIVYHLGKSQDPYLNQLKDFLKSTLNLSLSDLFRKRAF